MCVFFSKKEKRKKKRFALHNRKNAPLKVERLYLTHSNLSHISQNFYISFSQSTLLYIELEYK